MTSASTLAAESWVSSATTSACGRTCDTFEAWRTTTRRIRSASSISVVSITGARHSDWCCDSPMGKHHNEDKKGKRPHNGASTGGATAYSDGHPHDRVHYLEAKLILKPEHFTSVE